MRQIAYPILVFSAMAAWAVFHSWLAALRTKQFARELFGKQIDRYYRLIFVGVAVLTLTPILGMIVFLPSKLIWRIPPPWLYLSAIVQCLALVGLIVTVFQTDLLSFTGLRQLADPKAEERHALVTDGMYGMVRHPIYLFSILILWLFPYMTDLVLALVIASTLYFVIGTIPEERKMIETYGSTYLKYRGRVPRLIPWTKR